MARFFTTGRREHENHRPRDYAHDCVGLLGCSDSRPLCRRLLAWGENMKPHTIIGRSRNLWHAAGTKATSLTSLLPQASDGCLVYDAKRADEAIFVETVCEGPMLDESLPPGAIERLGQEWHGEPSSLDY